MPVGIIAVLLVLMSFLADAVSKGKVGIVGLNAALQRTVTLKAPLAVGEVNRGASVELGIGGKGQNVFVASTFMDLAAPSHLIQFLGRGAEGDTVEALLAQKAGDLTRTLGDLTVRTGAKCRTCITLCSDETSTEIVEPSGMIQPEELEELIQKLEMEVQEEKFRGLVIMGSMPPGCPTDLYGSIIEKTGGNETTVLIDSVVGVFDSISASLRAKCKTVLKINAREFYQLFLPFASSFSSSSSSSSSFSSFSSSSNAKGEGKFPALPPVGEAVPRGILQQVTGVMASVLQEKGLIGEKGSTSNSNLYVAITDGPHASHLLNLNTGSCWVITLPSNHPFPIVNPIGAGDAVASGMFHHLADRLSSSEQHPQVGLLADTERMDAAMLSALCWGVSCGVASCASIYCSVFDLGSVKEVHAFWG